MAFDFKKKYKEFYLPQDKPALIEIPPMNFVAVRGGGDPNQKESGYQMALQLLYSLSYTIKMSKMGTHRMNGYFDYVIPPLEGLWTQKGSQEIDYARKKDLQWVSMIRVPDFVTQGEFDWAVGEAARKKKLDFSSVELFTYEEGECIQCMHLGSYDDEPVTMRKIEIYMQENDYAFDLSENRFHHEIYLSDPRKTAPDRLRTVIRTPVRKG